MKKAYQNRHFCFCWCHFLAWCCFGCITVFSFVCISLATGTATNVKALIESIVVWINSTSNALTSFVGIIVSGIYMMYQCCRALADFVWGLIQPVIFFLDPILVEDIREECFAILGIAGSIIPAVYNSRTKRTKGILIADMIKYFFPLYGIVMLQNLVLSIIGQFVENINNWKYLFPAILITTAYSILLILAIGLYEKVSNLFIQIYIWEKSRILRPTIIRKQNSSFKNKRATFLKDLSSHIAEQIVASSAPHCNTDKRLKKEIQQIAKFMLSASERDTFRKEKSVSIVSEFDLLFGSSKQTRKYTCNAIYFGLPATESTQNFFALQIELACEFWKQIFNSIPSLNGKAHAACRIFYSMQYCTPKNTKTANCKQRRTQNYHGSLSVMVCGLIAYLHKAGHSEVAEKTSSNVKYCTDFVREMWNIFRADVPFGDDGTSISSYEISLYAEMLFILYALLQIEQYIHTSEQIESPVKELIDDFWKSSYVHIGRNLLLEEHFHIYIALAQCTLRQLPSLANRPFSPTYKKRMHSYVLAQKLRIGA